MSASRFARRSLAALLIGWLTTGGALANERWVILGGDIAETIAALDADIEVVARDDTVLHPPAMAALPSVGYLRQLSAESVLSVAPDRVLAAGHSGPKEVLEQLEAVGVTVDVIDAPTSLKAIPEKVQSVARLTERDDAGERLAAVLTDKLERLANLPALPSIRAMFIMQHSGLTPRAAGSNTAAHTALEAVGLENAFAEMQGYHSVGAEALAKEAPALVIMSQRGLDALGGENALWQLPGMRLTPAGREQRLIVIDDQALLGFGPRTPDQLLTLRQDIEALLGTEQASR
ncbi:heme/hemin ABC transporter substrate-binding protein [Vreelandella venusta]|uniref:ABC transporter substrate-binding protein n=1 Tax=Vreelandella venusta TaxID=44935 RepID=A0AAP9ZCV5_9GAMM|nr:ABC transporter substrate-binding protein [Halomonas venusta]MBR9925411.1 ABC transporter substrate-binding protein [Gammaproteobacteria bacterium]QRL02900.1 ABC transporter substrate-binding protein [Halomonas venusta]WAM48221.1 ABC transporter substrate-binding protein [Halomonas venusta]GEK51689.1 hemin ABC transporter substrate-binding protein [Halomonas venusta]